MGLLSKACLISVDGTEASPDKICCGYGVYNIIPYRVCCIYVSTKNATADFCLFPKIVSLISSQINVPKILDENGWHFLFEVKLWQHWNIYTYIYSA